MAGWVGKPPDLLGADRGMGPRVASLAAANVKPVRPGHAGLPCSGENAGLGPLLLGSWAMPSHSLKRFGYVIGAHGNGGMAEHHANLISLDDKGVTLIILDDCQQRMASLKGNAAVIRLTRLIPVRSIKVACRPHLHLGRSLSRPESVG